MSTGIKWLDRLFTVSKHTDPKVAAIEAPALAAGAQVTASAIGAGTAAFTPVLDAIIDEADTFADASLKKLGVTGQAIIPAAHAGLALAEAAIIAAVQARFAAARAPTPAPGTAQGTGATQSLGSATGQSQS